MASAQLAIFKVPAVDNEPMVSGFEISCIPGLTRYLSEAMVRGLWNEKGSKRPSLKWRRLCPLKSLALLTGNM